MTAAVFEAGFVPRVGNEVSKTKLHFHLSPAAGINLVLAPVRVHRYFNLDSDKSPPKIIFWTRLAPLLQNVVGIVSLCRLKCLKNFFKVDFSNFPSPNRKKIRASRDSLVYSGGGLVSRVSRATLNFY